MKTYPIDLATGDKITEGLNEYEVLSYVTRSEKSVHWLLQSDGGTVFVCELVANQKVEIRNG